MDDNMKMSGHPEGCRCGMCRMGMGGMGMKGGMWGGMMGGCWHRSPLYIIAKIVVLVFVFWLGTQVGELNAYRYGMMGANTYYRGGMMGGYGGGYGTSAQPPQNITVTTTPVPVQ
jgi:hypothetical protein